jgi:hypothetical protein
LEYSLNRLAAGKGFVEERERLTTVYLPAAVSLRHPEMIRECVEEFGHSFLTSWAVTAYAALSPWRTDILSPSKPSYGDRCTTSSLTSSPPGASGNIRGMRIVKP